MKTLARYGLVGVLTFLAGALWKFNFLKSEAPTQSSSIAATDLEQEKKALAQPPLNPGQGTVAIRAIEHYRDTIHIGVKDRHTQQRIHTEAKRKRNALAALEKRNQERLRLQEKKHLAEQEKVQQQLLSATQKAQHAQTKLAQERAEQARLETQWILDERKRHSQELALYEGEEKNFQKQEKRQRLLDLHAEHQLISTIQARKAKAQQRKLAAQRELEPCEAENRSRPERAQHQASSRHHQNQSRTASSSNLSQTRSPMQKPPRVIQQRREIHNAKESFLRQAQVQKELMRATRKK